MENESQRVNEDNLVADVRNELQEIDAMSINDHALRFEELHQRLSSALSSIDGL